MTGAVEDMRRALGDDDAAQTCLAFGGRDIYVPRQIPESHPIARALGAERARKLAAEYGGGELYVPLARRFLAAWLGGAGLSTAAIAQQLGISKSAARRYRGPRK